MSEDALVNIGAGLVVSHESIEPVRRMQVKLHRWARADRGLDPGSWTRGGITRLR